MIKIDRSAAEDSVRARLRSERAARFTVLDIAYMRALESGEGAAEIAAEKQALRDVPEKDFSALSLAELGALSLAAALEI